MKNVKEVKRVLDRATEDMPVFVEVNGFLLAVKSVSSEDVASRFSQPNPLGIADPEKWAVVITLGAS